MKDPVLFVKMFYNIEPTKLWRQRRSEIILRPGHRLPPKKIIHKNLQNRCKLFTKSDYLTLVRYWGAIAPQSAFCSIIHPWRAHDWDTQISWLFLIREGGIHPPVAHNAPWKFSKIFEVYTLLVSGVQKHPMHWSETILNKLLKFVLF